MGRLGRSEGTSWSPRLCCGARILAVDISHGSSSSGSLVDLFQLWPQLCCCCSVATSCLTLFNPMDCSTLDFPVLRHLPELTQTHVCWVSDAIHPTSSFSIICFSSCPQSFPAPRSFQTNQLFASGGQSIGVSASKSVNTQDWSPLGWTGWISLQSKGLSRVSSNTTVQKHQFFNAQLF